MSGFDSPEDRQVDERLRRQGEALRAERGGCPPPDLLLARRSEVLGAELRDRLDAHVSTCAACQRLADNMGQLDLESPDRDVAARVLARVSGSTRRGYRALLPLAAALVLAAGLAASWFYSRTRSAPASAPPGAVAESGRHAATPVVALWTIEPAPVRVPLSSLEVSRGGRAPTSDGAALVAALSPYQSGDFDVATVRLSQVAKDYPASGEAHFYLGVSQLLAGHPGDATTTLARASELLPQARRLEAEWYRATAEQRNGEIGSARARATLVCAQQGAYQAQACAAVRSLK